MRKLQSSSSMMVTGGGIMASSTVIEMQPMGSSSGVGGPSLTQLSSRSPSKSSPARSSQTQRSRKRPTDLASFDSSDTWASCHPFPSLTDLGALSPTQPLPALSSEQLADMNQLYVKPVANDSNGEDEDENTKLIDQPQTDFVMPNRDSDPAVKSSNKVCCP